MWGANRPGPEILYELRRASVAGGARSKRSADASAGIYIADTRSTGVHRTDAHEHHGATAGHRHHHAQRRTLRTQRAYHAPSRGNRGRRDG